MRQQGDPSAPLRAFDAEDTEAGSQTLVPGAQPVTLGERLGALASAPLLPRKGQRPANHGLFDTNARNKLELF